MICFYEGDANTPSIGYFCRYVHWQRMDPARVHSEHVFDKVGSPLGAIDGSAIPGVTKSSVMVAVRMTVKEIKK